MPDVISESAPKVTLLVRQIDGAAIMIMGCPLDAYKKMTGRDTVTDQDLAEECARGDISYHVMLAEKGMFLDVSSQID